MPEVLTALADPHRRAILDLLLEAPQPVGALVAATGLSQPGVSKHLRVLREVGLVEVRPAGQQRIYELRAEPLEELTSWLDRFRAGAAVDPGHALQRHLERRD
jgi:DNA-binding transcriptional ArsR family regulator